jgi:hypothetical protein
VTMRIARVLDAMRRRTRGQAPVMGALVLSYPLLVAAAVWPSVAAFGVFALVGYVAEAVAIGRAGFFLASLNAFGVGRPLRSAMREAALLILLARAGALPWRWFVAVSAGLALLYAVRGAHAYAAARVAGRRRLPALARGIDLTRLRIPGEPPRYVREPDLPFLEVPALGGGLLAAATGAVWPVAAGLAVTAAIGLAALAVTARHARLNRHLADRKAVLKAVAEPVAAYAPEVVLYFSGTEDSMYQVNMWLETFDRLDRRGLVILRERANLPLLGPTSSPVLCLPGGTEMMNFPLPESVRAALFPANAGKNIHMLRLPEIGCAFIGHGDSDKTASFSPFTKVYDEVWVAGPAGRERYLRSDAGVRDEDIVEVGRPQLAPIDAGTPGPIETVLYAPTWEGWTGDRFHTSVATMGPRLVRALLDHGVRVLYKPHPMGGKNDPAVRQAHQRIVAMVEAAGHRVVTGSHLYDCFNEADLLITDVSSVVADFLASGKPYVVTNGADLPDEEFRARNPSASAAYLLGRDCAGLAEILAMAAGDDEMAGRRRELRRHLLGPDDDTMARFATAVDALAAKKALR